MTEKASGPILVTGASSGFGRAITEQLSEQGHAVYATARQERDLSSLARLAGVTPLRLDVTRDDQVRRAVSAIHKQGEGLYGLVNNAGIADVAPLLDTSVEDWARVMDVNLYGVHRMVRACFPLLRASGGRIVNISSIGGLGTFPYAGVYYASKFALEAYSDVLRQELSGLGIPVSIIEPGNFRTPIFSKMMARKGADFVKGYAESPNREEFLKFLSECLGTPEMLHQTDRPGPGPVVEAVTDALFSSAPRPRYLVGTPDQQEWAISEVIGRLVQLGQSEKPPLSNEALLTRVKAALSASRTQRI